MDIAAVVILPIGLLFLISGLLVNLLQAIILVLVRPLSKNGYRRINKLLAELLWLELVWLFDWWANIKVELFADQETFEILGKERALLICNHRSDIDWLVGWVLAERANCLGSSLALIKKASIYLPVIGWSMWFSGFIFLERNWAKDEDTMKAGFGTLSDFPIPFWLALFVEGTRFTQEKLVAAQEFATYAGLPVPRNVLIPRTKGFVAAVTNLRSFVPVIYNMTVAVPKNEPQPTLLRLFRGRSSTVHVHVERLLMEELPETSSGIAQWCKDVFLAKDAFLERHLTTNTFGENIKQEIGRPKKSLLVVICWSCLVLLGIFKIFEMYPFSWAEVAVCAIFLGLVTIIMHMLIAFSQSERSTPPKDMAELRKKIKKDAEKLSSDKEAAEEHKKKEVVDAKEAKRLADKKDADDLAAKEKEESDKRAKELAEKEEDDKRKKKAEDRLAEEERMKNENDDKMAEERDDKQAEDDFLEAEENRC